MIKDYESVKRIAKELLKVIILVIVYIVTTMGFICSSSMILVTYPILPQCGMTCLEIGFLALGVIVMIGTSLGAVSVKFLYDRLYYKEKKKKKRKVKGDPDNDEL